MVRHCTYTNELMTRSADLCRDSALRHGCYSSTIYTIDTLDPAFVERNKAVLSQPKGAGYFIWKPQVIIQEMQQANNGDYILYTDAGIEIVNNVQHLTKSMDDFCLLFGGLFKQHDWCKGDCLIEGEYKQLNAAAMVFKKCSDSISFLNYWFELCERPGWIDDTPSVLPNHPSFQEHRWDQALLTNCQLEYEVAAHWWPARVGMATPPKENYTDNYPVIFNHHRRRNADFQA